MRKKTNTKTQKKQPVSGDSTAFMKTAAERAALQPHELMQINIDIEVAFAIAFSMGATLIEYRPEIAKLPYFDMKYVDNFKLYTQALGDAQMSYLIAAQPAEPLPELVTKAMAIRERFHADATALVTRGYLDPKRLTELKGGPGYVNVMSDVGLYSKLFREQWATIAPKTAMQVSELEEAEELRDRIAAAYGERAKQPLTIAAATDDRARAFTLFMRAYNQLRRAFAYLRYEYGDAEKVFPSLYGGRGGRNASADTTPPVNAPGASTPAPGNVAPSPVPAQPAAVAHEAPPPAVAGLPGGNPFTNN